LIERLGERDKNRIRTAKFTARRQSSSPIPKRIVQFIATQTEASTIIPAVAPALPRLRLDPSANWRRTRSSPAPFQERRSQIA
jgi:hypothetical protein